MSANLFKIIGMLAVAAVLWPIGGFVSASAYAQDCCGDGQHGSGHAGHGNSAPAAVQPGIPGGGHAGHQAFPVNTGMPGGQSAHQHGVGGGYSMCSGSACSESQQDKVAKTDVIKWPTLLQEPAFASRRGQIEAPYRQSPPKLSTPTASEYQNMFKTVEEMKAIVEWFPTKGVNTKDYEEAKAFLSKLGLEVRERYEIVSRATPAHAQQVVVLKPSLKVSLAALGEGDKAGIARQRVCPVTGAKLGGMGDPIKVLIDGQPLYLCCQGCLAKMEDSPEMYLAKVGRSHHSH